MPVKKSGNCWWLLSVVAGLAACVNAAGVDSPAGKSLSSGESKPATELARAAITTMIVDGLKLELMSEASCTLEYMRDRQEQRLVLKVPSPCAFHTDATGNVRGQNFPGGQVFLIQASRKHPELAGSCETSIQGLVIKNHRISVSQKTSELLSCPPFQWDAALFSAFWEGPTEP